MTLLPQPLRVSKIRGRCHHVWQAGLFNPRNRASSHSKARLEQERERQTNREQVTPPSGHWLPALVSEASAKLVVPSAWPETQRRDGKDRDAQERGCPRAGYQLLGSERKQAISRTFHHSPPLKGRVPFRSVRFRGRGKLRQSQQTCGTSPCPSAALTLWRWAVGSAHRQ